MNTIVIEKNHSMDVTVLSNYFLDEYMPRANGEYVKIYLYLVRCCCGGQEVSISSIADLFEHTEKDIMRALSYWQQLGLLGLSYDKNGHVERIIIKEVREDAPVTFKYVPDKHGEDAFSLDIEKVDVAEVAKISSEMEKNDEMSDLSQEDKSTLVAEEKISYTTQMIKEKRNFTAKELKAFNANEDIKQLLYIAQTYLGTTFSSSETNTILYFYDGLHFSVELIEFLIEYCVLNNHKAMRYIEKVAIDWAENGISTVEEAKEYTNVYAATYYPILNAFGISGRNIAAIEKAMIDKWKNDFGFSMDMIVEACNRTIVTISKPDFKYADGILKKWHNNNIATLDDLKHQDEKHNIAKENAKASKNVKVKTTTFNNFPQRDYDYDKLERQLLSRR